MSEAPIPGTPSAPARALRLVLPPAEPAPSTDERRPGPGQLGLVLEYPVPRALDVPPVPRRLRLVEDDGFERRMTPRRMLPPAAAWVARLAVAILEAADGRRPVAQLTRWVEPEILASLRAQARGRPLHPAAATHDRRAGYRVRSMRLDEPADGVIEASVLALGPRRPVGLALRLEGLDGRWVCTAVDSPDGVITGAAAAWSDAAPEPA